MSDTLQPEQKPKSIQDLISLAGTITPTIIGASFLLSICYDYFFLSTLGLSFSDIPSQISDHIRSAILWMPSIAGVISIAISILFGALIGGKKESHYNTPKIQAVEDRAWRTIPILLLFAAIVFLPEDIKKPTIIPIIIIISFLYSGNNYFFRSEIEKYSMYLAFITVSVMLVSIAANRDAKEILLTQKHALLITTKVNDTVSEIEANGIRRFSEFSIIVDENRQVIILPKDAILSTKNIKPVVIQESYACEYLKIMCADKITPPSKAASSP